MREHPRHPAYFHAAIQKRSSGKQRASLTLQTLLDDIVGDGGDGLRLHVHQSVGRTGASHLALGHNLLCRAQRKGGASTIRKIHDGQFGPAT